VVEIIFALLPALSVLAVGFVLGYGVREYLSRRRRTAIRRKFHEEHPEFGPP
jgi:hypothetical protein